MLSVTEAREKWPWFDFGEYFTTLFKDFPKLKEKISNHDFKFIIKAPQHMHDLQKLIYEEDDFGDFLVGLNILLKINLELLDTCSKASIYGSEGRV